MEHKTQIHAEDGQQQLLITRTFDLPLELLFTAYIEPEIVEQWMGTKVLKLEAKQHGSYHFETTDAKGNKHGFTGVIHDMVINEKIVRTFEMIDKPFGVQLEIYTFEKLTEDSSKLYMHVIYESMEKRNMVMQLPFAQGLNMAHDRIQNIVGKLK